MFLYKPIKLATYSFSGVPGGGNFTMTQDSYRRADGLIVTTITAHDPQFLPPVRLYVSLQTEDRRIRFDYRFNQDRYWDHSYEQLLPQITFDCYPRVGGIFLMKHRGFLQIILTWYSLSGEYSAFLLLHLLRCMLDQIYIHSQKKKVESMWTFHIQRDFCIFHIE